MDYLVQNPPKTAKRRSTRASKPVNTNPEAPRKAKKTKISLIKNESILREKEDYAPETLKKTQINGPEVERYLNESGERILQSPTCKLSSTGVKAVQQNISSQPDTEINSMRRELSPTHHSFPSQTVSNGMREAFEVLNKDIYYRSSIFPNNSNYPYAGINTMSPTSSNQFVPIINPTYHQATSSQTYQMFTSQQTSPPQPHPTVDSNTDETAVSICRNLNSCVINGSFDLFRAGEIMHHQYLKNNKHVMEAARLFIKNQSKLVQTYEMLSIEQYAHPQLHSIILQGQLLFGLLTKPSPIVAPIQINESDYKALVGSIYRTRNLTFHYPSTLPFSGDIMKITELPARKRTTDVDAHVKLKTHIFQLLSKSCSVPTDIQCHHWSLPNDVEFSTHTPFPSDLYFTMREFFLYYFGIEEPALECSHWEDAFADLECVRQWDSLAAKKRRTLSSARCMFMSREGYHKCLREALTEIRYAVYLPPDEFNREARWKYRNRTTKSTNAQEAERN